MRHILTEITQFLELLWRAEVVEAGVANRHYPSVCAGDTSALKSPFVHVDGALSPAEIFGDTLPEVEQIALPKVSLRRQQIVAQVRSDCPSTIQRTSCNPAIHSSGRRDQIHRFPSPTGLLSDIHFIGASPIRRPRSPGQRYAQLFISNGGVRQPAERPIFLLFMRAGLIGAGG